ncbi:hypothetical protein MBLNU13_g06993t1 [Cladosporium sp. NU13]
MPFIDIEKSAGAYSYGPGVNACNLTSQDIAKANAGLRDNMSKYFSWTRKELCKAIVERRIKSGKAVARMAKSQLEETLRKADKNPSFYCFLDLPPELRNEIYKHAIADLDPKRKPRLRPASPDICRVNRQTRSESLPLFLHSIDQTIIVSWVPTGPAPYGRQKAVLSDKYHTYFRNARKLGWLQHMRRFHFRIMQRNQSRGSNGHAKIDPNARYLVKFANMMEDVKTWRLVQKDKNGCSPKIKDDFLPKITAVMASTNNGEDTTMTAEKFNAMIAIFLDTVDLQFAA